MGLCLTVWLPLLLLLLLLLLLVTTGVCCCCCCCCWPGVGSLLCMPSRPRRQCYSQGTSLLLGLLCCGQLRLVARLPRPLHNLSQVLRPRPGPALVLAAA